MSQQEKKNDIGLQLRSFVEEWNLKYPIDKWWRDKYNVPFGSAAHKAQSMLDMRLDFEEELMFLQQKRRISTEQSSSYQFGSGSWLKKQIVKPTQQQLDKDFDRIDVTSDNIKEEIVNGKKRVTF